MHSALRSLRSAKRESGFTIIELMVTIAIVGILALIATPSFIEIKRNSELTSATNNLMAAINTARSEAMKRGYNAGVTPTGGGTDWNVGVDIFVDINLNGQYDPSNAPPDILVASTPILPSYLTIVSSNPAQPALIFNGSGYLARSATISNMTLSIARNDLTGTALVQQTRRIVVANTGRVRSCKPTSATDTSCSAASVE